MNTIRNISITIIIFLVISAVNLSGNHAAAQENGGRRHGPPPEAFTACEGKNAGEAAQFVSPHGDTVTGICESIRGRLVLRPDNPPPGQNGNGRQTPPGNGLETPRTGLENGNGGSVSGNSNYAVVDTGQFTCYNDIGDWIDCPAEGDVFFGQDAQYTGNRPDYTDNGNGTITDNVTGLTWTQSPDLNADSDIDADDKLTYNEALIYPDTLNAKNYGGYSDWRLPTIKELYSLMDFRGIHPGGPSNSGLTPFIDTTYFDFAYGDTAAGERIIDAQFWSGNAYVGSVFVNQPAAFGLNLADGRIKGYPTGGHVVKLNYVYFVRGNTDYGINVFNDNGDGTITDDATDLMWSRDDSGVGVNWEDALAWVRQKNNENYLGHSDWRLPNAKEMQSIVDYSRAPDVTGSAAIDPVFNVTGITSEGGEVYYPWFWTSTTHVRFDGSGSAAVYICFGRAMGFMRGAWMDVHGAGAQRSDRKGGDFSGLTDEPDGYYLSRAPQGDAIRIYNYVRLVRDADN